MVAARRRRPGSAARSTGGEFSDPLTPSRRRRRAGVYLPAGVHSLSRKRQQETWWKGGLPSLPFIAAITFLSQWLEFAAFRAPRETTRRRRLFPRPLKCGSLSLRRRLRNPLLRVTRIFRSRSCNWALRGDWSAHLADHFAALASSRVCASRIRSANGRRVTSSFVRAKVWPRASGRR